MKYFLALILLFILYIGCKPKLLSGKALEDKLIEIMGDYLHKTLKPGTTFTIKKVIYYPEVDEKLYDCQFHVSLQYGNKDTTGIMAATITNDFKKVARTQ